LLARPENDLPIFIDETAEALPCPAPLNDAEPCGRPLYLQRIDETFATRSKQTDLTLFGDFDEFDGDAVSLAARGSASATMFTTF